MDDAWTYRMKSYRLRLETEKEEERKAIKLQRWQRDKFAKEMGFDPDTTEPAEIRDYVFLWCQM